MFIYFIQNLNERKNNRKLRETSKEERMKQNNRRVIWKKEEIYTGISRVIENCNPQYIWNANVDV
jgi:hypothetical protein